MNNTENEKEIARQLSTSFDNSKVLADVFTEAMDKNQSTLASVAFALAIIDDIMIRAFPSHWPDNRALIEATFQHMKEMGAFVPPEMRQ